MSWYVIMKLIFESPEAKKSKSGKYKVEDAVGDGLKGTNGNPDNHWPSIKIKMHELQKAEKDPCVLYKIYSTNY